MRIGVDVGGTNTDAVLVDGVRILASTKQPTTADISSGVGAAIRQVLTGAGVAPGRVATVMIGTTHFTNALVERKRLDEVGVIRLASPAGEALPPFIAWPADLTRQTGDNCFLLPGGYEVDGREISPLDETRVREAARTCRKRGIRSIAVSSVFAPLNSAMEERASRIITDAYPEAELSLSHSIGRLGMIERENGTILNAALNSLAKDVIVSYERALREIGLNAPLYVSQNDGTLISAAYAARFPVMTIGSGPTNSMRGAAFLTGLQDGIVMDVGGTTCDIGVLTHGFPRESSVAVDIGGVRTNFRMPDILAIGLGGGTRIHLSPELYQNPGHNSVKPAIGPDSVGYRITEESHVFGGATLTASDIAVMTGHVQFGDVSLLPSMNPAVRDTIWSAMQEVLADGVDRMKTAPGNASVIVVGGGHFLVGSGLKGVAEVVRPPHAEVANAVGAAIAQIGAQLEQIVNYDTTPREEALAGMRQETAKRVAAAGGAPDTIEIVEMEEVYLSYLPGRSAQVRMKAVGDLAHTGQHPDEAGHRPVARLRHAN